MAAERPFCKWPPSEWRVTMAMAIENITAIFWCFEYLYCLMCPLETSYHCFFSLQSFKLICQTTEIVGHHQLVLIVLLDPKLLFLQKDAETSIFISIASLITFLHVWRDVTYFWMSVAFISVCTWNESEEVIFDRQIRKSGTCLGCWSRLGGLGLRVCHQRDATRLILSFDLGSRRHVASPAVCSSCKEIRLVLAECLGLDGAGFHVLEGCYTPSWGGFNAIMCLIAYHRFIMELVFKTRTESQWTCLGWV